MNTADKQQRHATTTANHMARRPVGAQAISAGTAPVLLRLPDLTLPVRTASKPVEIGWDHESGAPAPISASAVVAQATGISEQRRATKQAAAGQTVTRSRAFQQFWLGEKGKWVVGAGLVSLAGLICVVMMTRREPGHIDPAVPQWNENVFEPPEVELGVQSWSAEGMPPATLHEAPAQQAVAQQPLIGTPPAMSEVESFAPSAALSLEGPQTSQTEAAAHPHRHPPSAEEDADPSSHDMPTAPLYGGERDLLQHGAPVPARNFSLPHPVARRDAPPDQGQRYPQTSPSTWVWHNDYPQSSDQQVRIGQRPDYPHLAPSTPGYPQPGQARLNGTIETPRDRLR